MPEKTTNVNGVAKRRNALKLLAAAGTSSVLFTGMAAGSKETQSSESDRREKIPPEWINENGDLSIPESDLDDFDVIVSKTESDEVRTDVITNVKNVEYSGDLESRAEEIVSGDDWSSPLYRTLYSTDFEGYSVEINAGLRARTGTEGVEISLDFTIQIDAIAFDVYSLQLGQNEDDGFCITVSAPPQFPIEFNICADIQWAGGTAITIGGSGDVCLIDICPIVDCGICRGLGLSGDIDFGSLV